MGQDLRKMFEEERKKKDFPMRPGHEARFLDKLEMDLPKKSKSSRYLPKIAASIAIMFGIAITGYLLMGEADDVNTTVVKRDNPVDKEQGISLGDLSPDLKKVENYYVANINLELSRLEVSGKNKVLVDSFMDQLSELNMEYEKLNAELNEIGPNDQTINALIKNLQLRLQLLHRLRTKLNELKSSKNEQVEDNTI